MPNAENKRWVRSISLKSGDAVLIGPDGEGKITLALMPSVENVHDRYSALQRAKLTKEDAVELLDALTDAIEEI